MSNENLDHNNSKTVEINEEAFDLTGLLLDYLSHWKWFLISAVAFLVGAYFYIATIVPTYKVDASLYLNKQDTQAGAATLDPNSQLVAMKTFIDETELEILKSRNNVIDIVDSLNMAYSYWRKGNFRDIPLYENNAIEAKLDSLSLLNLTAPIELTVSNASTEGKYDITAKTNFNGTPEDKHFENIKLPCNIELSQGTVTLSRVSHVPALEGTEKIIIRNRRAVAGQLAAALNISFADRASTIVRISLLTNLPREGIDVINTLVDLYNRQIIEDKNRSAMQTEAFILERLVMINDELRDVEQRLQDYRQAHNIADLSAQLNSSLSTKTASESQLADVEAQRQIISSIENVVAKADEYTALPSATSDNALNTVIESYNRKVSQLNRMMETQTADNPVVKSVQEELTREKSRILQNISSVKSGLNARRKNIVAIEGRSAGALSSVPTIDKGLQEIFREQQVKVNIYTFLLQKREEIALQKTLATPTARLIDDPVGGGPVSPNVFTIYMIALLLGLALPAAVIFLRRFFFPVFKDQEELQRLTQLPIIGEISNDYDNSEPIVVGENVSTSIAELFRLLRNNIGFTKNGAEKKVILVTSSISGEGKTFVAVNLAMTYALTGKKVVVVGMDIRRPVLAHRFGFTNQYGITTFLSGQSNDISKLIYQSKENENLYILPAGPVPPNPNELLLSSNMTRLMEQLRHDFDYVIIDSAPIGLISDSFLIVPHTDIQLFVTRASYSTKSCLKVLHQAVKANKLSDPYIILNGVDMKSGSYTYRKYGHYSHSNNTYGYAYGYGYSSDKPKKDK